MGLQVGARRAEIAGLRVEDEESGAELSVILPADVTSYQVSDDLIGLAGEWKYEVLVREASGNQTATESCFEVE